MVSAEDNPNPYVCWTRSFAAAMWLIAKGYALHRVAPSTDGSMACAYAFPIEAQPELRRFYQEKETLNQKTLTARGR